MLKYIIPISKRFLERVLPLEPYSWLEALSLSYNIAIKNQLNIDSGTLTESRILAVCAPKWSFSYSISLKIEVLHKLQALSHVALIYFDLLCYNLRNSAISDLLYYRTLIFIKQFAR